MLIAIILFRTSEHYEYFFLQLIEILMKRTIQYGENLIATGDQC